MATTKRFKITKKAFLNYIFFDQDDKEYWGNRFMEDLKRDGMIKETVNKIFSEKDSLPAHLFYAQLTEEEAIELEYDEIPISEITLVNIL